MTSPSHLLDAVQAVTHLGPGSRAWGQQLRPPATPLEAFAAHPLPQDGVSMAIEHFGTQGDGNHVAFVGTIRSTGSAALVTHEGRGARRTPLRQGHVARRDELCDPSPETPAYGSIMAGDWQAKAPWRGKQQNRAPSGAS